MRISKRNWFTAFSVAIVMHASITFGWLFLTNNQEIQAAGENAIRVSLGEWQQTLTEESSVITAIPEVPAIRDVISAEVASIAIESSVLTEVQRVAQIEQIRDTNADQPSEMAETRELTEVSDLANPVIELAATAKPTPTEEVLFKVQHEEPSESVTQQSKSAQVNRPSRTVPSRNKDRVLPGVEQALAMPASFPSHKHSEDPEETGYGRTVTQPETTHQDLTALSNGQDDTGDEQQTSTIRAEYIRLLQSRLNAQKRYPNAAKRRGATGTAKVRFIILADGSMVSSELLQSTGNQHLDKEALRMLSRAEPFPPIPKGLKLKQIDLQIPIVFELH